MGNETPTGKISPSSSANGGRNGVIGRTLAVLATLPPAFLALIVLNLLFIAVMGWVLDAHGERRLELIEKVLESCLDK